MGWGFGFLIKIFSLPFIGQHREGNPLEMTLHYELLRKCLLQVFKPWIQGTAAESDAAKSATTSLKNRLIALDKHANNDCGV